MHYPDSFMPFGDERFLYTDKSFIMLRLTLNLYINTKDKELDLIILNVALHENVKVHPRTVANNM